VLIPPNPGHFSAYGMLFADFRYDLLETIACPLDALDVADMNLRFANLEAEGRLKMGQLETKIESLHFTRYAEMRYQRQEYTIKVKLPAACGDRGELRRLFEEHYQRRYGHASKTIGVDVVVLRVVVGGATARPRESLPTGDAGGKVLPARRPIWFAEIGMAPCDVWQRNNLWLGQCICGPALIEESASTTVIAPGDVAVIDDWGNIAIALKEAA
jgi:N-methylhydantoinase A